MPGEESSTPSNRGNLQGRDGSWSTSNCPFRYSSTVESLMAHGVYMYVQPYMYSYYCTAVDLVLL
jgi:hypothetical protein